MTSKNIKNTSLGSQRRKLNSSSKMPNSSQKSQKLSQEKLEQIDTALGYFFFGCNIPFKVVESQFFKNFLASLIPPEVYSPPTRKCLSTTILDRIYNDIVTKRALHCDTDGVLLIDGWKNSSANKNNVVCTIHTAGDKSLFLNSWDMTGISETGNQLKIVVDEAVVMAKEKYNITIYGVVSDNASPMLLMGKIVNIWHSSCNSHSGNLLAKSFVSKDYAAKINKLLKPFRNPGPENELKKKGGTRVILGCDTRWCSYRDSFKCLLKNLHLMRELVKEKLVILDTESKELIESLSFESEITDYILIFDPICELINICQQSKSSIADASEAWLKLEIPTNNDNYEQILSKRLDKVISPLLLAANLLHPEFRGRNFKNIDQLSKATEFIEIQLTSNDSINNESINVLSELSKKIQLLIDVNDINLKDIKLLLKKSLASDTIGSKSKAVKLYQETTQHLLNYMTNKVNEEIFNELEVLKQKIESRVEELQVILDKLGLNNYLQDLQIFEKIKTFTLVGAFWTAAGPSYPRLTALAWKILKIPASSAQLERLFSSWAYIHSDIRNRLSVDRSMKLVDIYYSLKMNESFDEYYDGLLED